MDLLYFVLLVKEGYKTGGGPSRVLPTWSREVEVMAYMEDFGLALPGGGEDM